MENKRAKSAFLFASILAITLSGVGFKAHAQIVGASRTDNWAGYTSIGSNFTEVGATWTVPQVQTSNTLKADTTWVGIGGVNNTNLIQAGTEAITHDGSIAYHAWYEMLPDVSVIVPLNVKPGDSITTKIAEVSANNWEIDITNNTTSQSWSKTVYYVSNKSSAEWIEEAPSHSSGQIDLDYFGSVNFTGAYAVTNGSTYSANDFPLHSMSIINGSELLASPTSFSSNNSDFTVKRLNTPVVATPAPAPIPVETPSSQIVASNPTPAPTRATASVLPGTVHYTLAYVIPGKVYKTKS